MKHQRKIQLENRVYFGPEYNFENDLVFCKENGDSYYPTIINRKFNKLLKKAGLPAKYNIHSLRHTHATLLLKQGIAPKVIQERLGHASIAVTMDVYSHVTPNMQKEAAEKMDKLLSKNLE